MRTWLLPGAALISLVVGSVAWLFGADRVRNGLPAFFRELRELGITRTLLLSGDSASHTAAVAREVGITDARGDVLLLADDVHVSPT